MIGLEFEEPIKELRSRLTDRAACIHRWAVRMYFRLLPLCASAWMKQSEFLERFKKSTLIFDI